MVEISRGEDIAYAVIVSPEGKAMTSHINRRNVFAKEHLLTNNEIDIQSLVNHAADHASIIQQSFPILIENKVLGYFKIGINKNRMEALIREKLIGLVVVSGIFTLLLGLGVYFIFRFYTR